MLPEAAVRTWQIQEKGLGLARYRAERPMNLLSRGAGASDAIGLHRVVPVKGYVGDASLPPLHGVAVPETFVALSACLLPLAEAQAGCWNPSGCGLWTVLVVDCGLRSGVCLGLNEEVRGVKRFEGEEQVAGAQKRRVVAARQKDRDAVGLTVEGVQEVEPSTASRLG